MELPTQDDFNFYDVNGDGTLTMEEWEETEAKAMEIAKAEDEEWRNLPMAWMIFIFSFKYLREKFWKIDIELQWSVNVK